MVHAADGQLLATDDDLSRWLGRGVRLAAPPTRRQPVYEFPVDPEDESGMGRLDRTAVPVTC